MKSIKETAMSIAIKNAIKYDLNAKNTVEVMLIDICRQSW